MTKKEITLLGVLFLCLVIVMYIFFRNQVKEAPLSSETHQKSERKDEEETIQKKKILLFFPSEEDSLLHGEEREIISSSLLIEEARQVVEELLKGSNEGYISPFPPETKLRELFLTEEGVAYVDFSRDIQEKHISGSSAELATIYSIVNSLVYNFKPIKKVFILVEGREKETLGGHINLSQAFKPEFDLVAK